MIESDSAHAMSQVDLSPWIGNHRLMEERLDPKAARLMQQTLNREADLGIGDALPPAWHWLYFIDSTKLSDTDRDGHGRRGNFLPPVPLPRRMWAGSRLTFHNPIYLGDTITRESRIADIQYKKGQSGPLCFVCTSHTYRKGGECLLEEEHDIVYREDPVLGIRSSTPPAADLSSDAQRTIQPSPLMLFRYSALTFNGHRIHYDIDYCRNVENYPGLVVHGPLTATLLLDMLADEVGESRIGKFRFRAITPLFADHPFTLHLRKNDGICHLWAANPENRLAVHAEAEIA